MIFHRDRAILSSTHACYVVCTAPMAQCYGVMLRTEDMLVASCCQIGSLCIGTRCMQFYRFG